MDPRPPGRDGPAVPVLRLGRTGMSGMADGLANRLAEMAGVLQLRLSLAHLDSGR